MEVDMVKTVYGVCLSFLLASTALAQGEWELAGFSDCRITCIAQHPSDTSLMYITILDTVYKSTDGGHAWTYAVSFNNLPVNDLQFHPIDHDMICALVGNGSWSDGIYCSTDGGYSWDVLSYFYIPLALVIPADSSSLWVVGCDTFGVYKSTDNGATWTLWNEGLVNLHVNALSHTWRSDTLVFLAGTGQGLFYRCTDAWSLANGISDMLPVVSIVHLSNAAYGCAAVGNGTYSDGIYHTTDFGETWQVAEWWVFPSCVTMSEMWGYPRDTCTVLAGDSGLGVKRSEDFGSTWSAMNAGLDNLFINVLSFHRQTPLRLFAGTDAGLYRYDYESGCEEQGISSAHRLCVVRPTIVRPDQSFSIAYQSDERNPKTDWLVSIHDASGRLMRKVPLINGVAEISPLRACGTYFVRISGVLSGIHQKIIVVE